jgi:hypothetical protein
MRNLKIWILGSLAFLLFFGGAAFAADTISPDTSSLDIAKAIYDAFAGGHYAYMAAMAVILLVAFVKRYLGDKITWLHSNAAGTLMALIGATATALVAAASASGGVVSFALLKSALLVGVGAAGGYAVLKALLVDPILVPLLSKYSWGAPILAVINFVFDHGAGAAAVAESKAAGDAAVAAAPAKGAAAVLGAPTEVK